MSIYGLLVDEGVHYPRVDGRFRPNVAYPEYPFEVSTVSHSDNTIYEGVRRLLQITGLDAENFETASWNPLGAYIQPGDRVLVKPNLVMDVNPSGHGVDCLYTHPSVVAAVIDYVIIAQRGEGSIILGDAPMQTCNFEKLTDQSGLRSLVDWYCSQGIDIKLVDLRGLRSSDESNGLNQKIVDGVDGCIVDLGTNSSFYGLSEEHLERLRITNYDPRELSKHHSSDRHEYCVSRHLLDADVIVNLPKAKTHRKAGITGALKNMVGINVRKEYLPHHTFGSKEQGFDEYEKRSLLRAASSALLDAKNRTLGRDGNLLRSVLNYSSKAVGALGKRLSGDTKSEGSWSGNDTIWRTVLDLNMIVRYADHNGVMRSSKQREMITLTDMVVIGQGEGPLLPEPGEWGMLSFSDSPVVSDIAMARLLGTDRAAIPSIGQTLSHEGAFRIADSLSSSVICKSNDSKYNGIAVGALNENVYKAAKPTSGWLSAFKRNAAC